jgi:hypothetical protein
MTVIILNLLLFFSLWKVPSLTSAFMQSGISQVASGLGNNLVDRAGNFAKDVSQLYGAGKVIKAASAISKAKSFSSNGKPLGSHKYRAIQNKKG